MYDLAEALENVLKSTFAKFDESVDVAVRLGVDPRHADQMVRSSVILPNGTGKTARVLVFAKGEKEKEALAAGADYAGADELIQKIKGGWLDFDKTIATLQKERSKLEKTSLNLKEEETRAREEGKKMENINVKIKQKLESYQELYDSNQKTIYMLT